MGRALAGLLLLVAVSRADAHPAPFSYLDLHLRESRITGVLVVHVVDLAHDLQIEPALRLLDPNVAAANLPHIVALLTSRFRLVADGQLLAPQWDDVDALPGRQSLRLTFTIGKGRPAALAIDARLFPYDRFHQTFVNIYEDGELRQQLVFAQNDRARTYFAGTARGRLAVASVFVPAGIHHILIGPDHILFLVGLLLLGGGSWALLRIVTAFTLGHSITLSLAALSIVIPPAHIVEPVIALSIIFVGVDNLLARPGGRDVRAWVALAFGLVHGFGFAGVLREFGIPDEAIGWSLFSFNVGVEIGQLVVVATVAAALAAVGRWSGAFQHKLAYVGSVVVILAGTYWFIERVFADGFN